MQALITVTQTISIKDKFISVRGLVVTLIITTAS